MGDRGQTIRALTRADPIASPAIESPWYNSIMPRFSVRDLLIATSLMAAGLALCLSATRLDRHSLDSFPIIVPAYFLGSTVFGAGILYPFLPWQIGGTVGFVGGLILAAFFV